jgi:hypothetical protein
MKTINKNALKYSFFVVLALLVIVFVVKIEAMRMSPSAQRRLAIKRSAYAKKKPLDSIMQSLQPEEYYVYQEGTTDGIVVPLKVVLKSTMLKSMIDDFGGTEKAISLHLPISVIRRVFAVLGLSSQEENAKTLAILSLDQLIEDIKACNYLEIPKKLLKIFMLSRRIILNGARGLCIVILSGIKKGRYLS